MNLISVFARWFLLRPRVVNPVSLEDRYGTTHRFCLGCGDDMEVATRVLVYDRVTGEPDIYRRWACPRADDEFRDRGIAHDTRPWEPGTREDRYAK